MFPKTLWFYNHPDAFTKCKSSNCLYGCPKVCDIYAPTESFWKRRFQKLNHKGLSLLAIGLAIGVLLSGVETSNGIVRALSLVDPLIAMLTANYAYYLHVVHHSVSWNPFEGMGRRKTDAPRFDPSA